MMMDYEWGNPASAAAAMLLFGEESGADTGQDQRAVFDHYGVHGLNTIGISDYFPQPPQPLTAAALFSPSSSSSSSCHPRYGLALPPAPTRIGLNLGVRTYFSSASPEDELAAAAGNPPRACRRRTRTARCQAEGCGADLTHAKHYHRRHKVCEFHSKASIVITAGLSQRFCQQCSRFHVLAEFDQGKRSCRKRLADHNRRRRKSQDLSTAPISSQANNNAPNIANTNSSGSSGITTSHSPAKPETALFNNNNNNNNNSSTNNNNDINNDNNNNDDDDDDGGQINNRNSAFSAFIGCNPEGDSSASHVSSTLAPRWRRWRWGWDAAAASSRRSPTR
uniref:SBP-type domain-containing protein n=1 Tax=Ananas comosus var. bracteatus TaxID=296719 RepID=A0A6V7QPS6_ANACO|nr:unnamed protein product [Ananas comosus var. bracteatus]